MAGLRGEQVLRLPSGLGRRRRRLARRRQLLERSKDEPATNEGWDLVLGRYAEVAAAQRPRDGGGRRPASGIRCAPMESALRVLAFVAGAAVVLLTLRSAIRTFLVPRALQAQLSRVVFVLVRRVFRRQGDSLLEAAEAIVGRIVQQPRIVEKEKRLAYTCARVPQRGEALERRRTALCKKEVGGRRHHEVGCGDHICNGRLRYA